LFQAGYQPGGSARGDDDDQVARLALAGMSLDGCEDHATTRGAAGEHDSIVVTTSHVLKGLSAHARDC
jgi:hypothetical protein